MSSWTPAAEPRYVETVVAPPTPAEVAAAQARGELPLPQRQERQEQEQEQGREQEQHEQQQETRFSDFSSLYSATPHRAVSGWLRSVDVVLVVVVCFRDQDDGAPSVLGQVRS